MAFSVLLTGCGVGDAIGNAAEDAAQDAADEAVEQASDVAADQAQEALDSALAQVDESSATCAAYSALAGADRSAAVGGLLQAFWFADLSTEQPGADLVSAYVADVDARCAAAPEATVTAIAQEAYDSGSYSPGG